MERLRRLMLAQARWSIVLDPRSIVFLRGLNRGGRQRPKPRQRERLLKRRLHKRKRVPLPRRKHQQKSKPRPRKKVLRKRQTHRINQNPRNQNPKMLPKHPPIPHQKKALSNQAGNKKRLSSTGMKLRKVLLKIK